MMRAMTTPGRCFQQGRHGGLIDPPESVRGDDLFSLVILITRGLGDKTRCGATTYFWIAPADELWLHIMEESPVDRHIAWPPLLWMYITCGAGCSTRLVIRRRGFQKCSPPQ